MTTVFDNSRMGERLVNDWNGIVDSGDPRGWRARKIADARRDGRKIAETVNSTFREALQPATGGETGG